MLGFNKSSKFLNFYSANNLLNHNKMKEIEKDSIIERQQKELLSLSKEIINLTKEINELKSVLSSKKKN